MYSDVSNGIYRVSKHHKSKDLLLADLRLGGLNETTLAMLEEHNYVPSMTFYPDGPVAHGVAVSDALTQVDAQEFEELVS